MIEIKEKLFTDEIKRLAPVLGKETAERLAKAYLIGDETTRQRIVEMLDVLKAAVMADPQLRDVPLLEPPPRMEGEIEMGNVLYGRKEVARLCFEKEAFMTHIGIFGSSGYGKTNLSYNIIKQLSDKNVPVIVFDFSKKNYRDLKQTDLSDRINIYTLGSNVAPLIFNPLKAPPGVSTTQWAKEFAEIFDHAYWLLGGGRHIILRALSRLYEENEKPILTDLKRHIEDTSATTAREKNWIATSLRPLESLGMRETGEIFAMPDGVRPSSFFQPGNITILEMDALSTNDKTFFIEIVLQWIRDWLLVSGEREALKGVIILEEAHHILNREKAKKIGSETVMDLVFREMRELGMGVVYLDQHPSMVSYPALGNTSTHIYMNLGLDTKYSSDVQDAVNMLGLEEEDGEYMRRLPVGHGFVLMRHSEWTRPFAAKFPLFNIKKGLIKDSDVAALMKHKIGEPSKQVDTERVDETQWRVFQAIGSGKGVFTSQLYKSLRLSGSSFKEHIEILVRAGMVGVREVRIEKTKANYYYLTDAGEKIFAEKFPNDAKTAHHGSGEEVENMFRSIGWNYKRNGDEFQVEKDEKLLTIKLLTEFNRDYIARSVSGGVSYICGSSQIRNVLLQHAAKLANRTGKMRISVATIEDFGKRGFEEYIV